MRDTKWAHNVLVLSHANGDGGDGIVQYEFATGLCCPTPVPPGATPMVPRAKGNLIHTRYGMYKVCAVPLSSALPLGWPQQGANRQRESADRKNPK
jgi:hypothetical protein